MLDVEIVKKMYIELAKEHHKITMSDSDEDVTGINIYLGALSFVLGDDCPTWQDILREEDDKHE